jgi:hypothetical protein
MWVGTGKKNALCALAKILVWAADMDGLVGSCDQFYRTEFEQVNHAHSPQRMAPASENPMHVSETEHSLSSINKISSPIGQTTNE